MFMDNSGNNHLTIELEAGWDLQWESKNNNKYNGMYAGLSWCMVNSDDVDINSDDTVTLKNGAEIEFAILGAKRDSGDRASDTTPALDFYDLIQDTTNSTSADYSKEDIAIFGNSIVSNPNPDVWELEEATSTDVLDSRGRKKYIVGMGAKATRPFVPSSSRKSELTIQNLNEYIICASNWIAYDGENGHTATGCDTL